MKLTLAPDISVGFFHRKNRQSQNAQKDMANRRKTNIFTDTLYGITIICSEQLCSEQKKQLKYKILSLYKVAEFGFRFGL